MWQRFHFWYRDDDQIEFFFGLISGLIIGFSVLAMSFGVIGKIIIKHKGHIDSSKLQQPAYINLVIVACTDPEAMM